MLDSEQQVDWAVQRLDAKIQPKPLPVNQPPKTPLQWLATMFWGTVAVVGTVAVAAFVIYWLIAPLLVIAAYALLEGAFTRLSKE